MLIWIVLVILILTLWVVTRFFLRGEDLSGYDKPRPSAFAAGDQPSEQHKAIVAYLQGFAAESDRSRGKARLQRLRERMDAMSDGRDYVSQFIAADAWGVGAGSRGRQFAPVSLYPRWGLYVGQPEEPPQHNQ